ncbi:hypothetical protein GOQ27_01155 [Clostridium sp. D2Q-11]|uniref:Uncharacterized protein n=1 Tax=Anaeromonas frigoriresistens TaxID=2683708 RepID=A0A942UPY7_9FIRM|nr:hypothetical protein [Anaeromonas frigoriresistens]MBS4537048.1 hypothetical protein [Anaeromonas frigoriresistens]
MTRLKNQQIKKIIFSLVILLTLIIIYWGYRVYIEYRGVYNIVVFIPLLFLPISYRMILKDHEIFLRWRIVTVMILSIALPLLIYFTLPKYTYNEGQKRVIEYLNTTEKVEFINYSRGEDTIPVMNNPKGFLIKDRTYYYHVKVLDKDRYFMVNPIMGKVGELPNAYWHD